MDVDVDVERVKELRDSGMGASAIAKQMGIGRASVIGHLGRRGVYVTFISAARCPPQYVRNAVYEH